MHFRYLYGIVLCALFIWVVACGHEDPVFELTSGSVEVFSTPDGARIFLDDLPLGLVTPDTLEQIPQGEHTLQVQLEGYRSDPEQLSMQVVAGEMALAEFILEEIPGSLAITSTPQGASIFINGLESGEITDATLTGLAPGEHVVTVVLDGYTAQPESLIVIVEAEGVAAADFTLTPEPVSDQKIVLLEGFSNVCCTGCPEMNAALHELLSTPGYDSGRVLLIKYAVGFPATDDPHYLANTADNDARAWGPSYDMSGYYSDAFAAVPALFVEGTGAGDGSDVPLLQSELRALIDPLLGQEPGFAIQVESSRTGTEVHATIRLVTSGDVDLSGMSLNAVLVQNPVIHTSVPACAEEMEYHWIMREFENVNSSIGVLQPGNPAIFQAMLPCDLLWPAGDLHVIAFVQDDLSRSVLQAGSTIGMAPGTNPDPAATSSSISSTSLNPGDQP